MEYHQPFKKWHKENLIDFIKFIKVNYPLLFDILIRNYDEMLRGN